MSIRIQEVDVDTRNQLNAKSQVIRGTIYLVAMLAVCVTLTAIAGTILENLHTLPDGASL